MRRKRKRDIGDLSADEYATLKKETDERIERDYAPGNIVELMTDIRPTKKGAKGICFADSFVAAVTGIVYVTRHVVFENGEEIQLGYNTFETVKPTGDSASIDVWIAANVGERQKRRKRNS